MAKEILIADSDKAEQEEFKNVFKETDYHLVFSESGEQVLLRIKLFKPDLIFAGKSLKDKSGLEVCKAIKADRESKHIPVILFSDIFKGISEEDRKRVQADGIINRPIHEDEVLNLVDRLIEKEETRARDEGIIGKETEWKSVADISRMGSEEKEEFLLDEVGEMEGEEIIDLVDVVEEPERKMSIDDFVAKNIEEPSMEITPLESWEKLMEEEKPADSRFKFGPDEQERSAKGLSLQLGDEMSLRKEIPERELFNKIELEEILQKMEKIAPSIEGEWPPEEKPRAPEKVIPATEEPSEKYEGLAEFEAALKKGLGIEPLEEKIQPFGTERLKEGFKEERKEEQIEESKKEVPEEIVPVGVSLEEELKEVQEEFPEPLLEELGKGEVRILERPQEKGMEVFEEIEIPEVEKEEIRIIEEPEEEEIKIFEEEIETPPVLSEELKAVEEPEEERIEIFEEIGAPEVEKEEIRIIEVPEEERIEIFEEVEAPEVSREEIRVFEKPQEERVEMFEEVTAPEITTPFFQKREIAPPLRAVERQMEEVISKGAREMMEGFITRLVPEMTQSIINLAIERIERMVKEIVPEIAEKMIQEEIKRLKKGEKD